MPVRWFGHGTPIFPTELNTGEAFGSSSVGGMGNSHCCTSGIIGFADGIEKQLIVGQHPSAGAPSRSHCRFLSKGRPFLLAMATNPAGLTADRDRWAFRWLTLKDQFAKIF
jgi:hypothetical protein